FYGNLLYLIVGFIWNFLLYLLLKMFIPKNYTYFHIIHFLLCLFPINLISFYFENRFITFDFLKTIFNGEYDNIVIILTHLFIIVSYVLALVFFKITPNLANKG